MGFIESVNGVVKHLGDLELNPNAVALVLIDMQRLDASPKTGIGPGLLRDDSSGEAEAYFDRLQTTVIPNLADLLAGFRETRRPIAHVRIASASADGVGLGWRYRRLGISCAAPRDAEFVEPLVPEKDEAVIDKLTSSAFVNTNLDSWLRAMGVTSLVVGGVVTNGCVESTVRVGADLGYHIWLVEDGCAALTQKGHEASIGHLHGNYARVVTRQMVKVSLL